MGRVTQAVSGSEAWCSAEAILMEGFWFSFCFFARYALRPAAWELPFHIAESELAVGISLYIERDS